MAGVFLHIRAQPKPLILKQPPESSVLPQTQRHLLSSAKASAESFFLLRAEHLREFQKKKKKGTGSFLPLSCLLKRAAWIHSPIQIPAAGGGAAAGEAQDQPDSPCPGGTRYSGGELRPGAAQYCPPTRTATGCINPRTHGQV